MKHLFTVVLGLALSVGICLAGEQVDLTIKRDKASYSIGYQVGGDFMRQDLVIRPEMLLKGVQDGLGDLAPAMTKLEMRQTLVNLQKRVATAQARKSKEEVERNQE